MDRYIHSAGIHNVHVAEKNSIRMCNVPKCAEGL